MRPTFHGSFIIQSNTYGRGTLQRSKPSSILYTYRFAKSCAIFYTWTKWRSRSRESPVCTSRRCFALLCPALRPSLILKPKTTSFDWLVRCCREITLLHLPQIMLRVSLDENGAASLRMTSPSLWSSPTHLLLCSFMISKYFFRILKWNAGVKIFRLVRHFSPRTSCLDGCINTNIKEQPTKKMLVYFVGWEQERPISARRVRTSYLGSARKNVLSRLGA